MFYAQEGFIDSSIDTRCLPTTFISPPTLAMIAHSNNPAFSSQASINLNLFLLSKLRVPLANLDPKLIIETGEKGTAKQKTPVSRAALRHDRSGY